MEQLEPYKRLLDVYTADFFLRPRRKSKGKSPLMLLDGTRGDPLDVINGKTKLQEDEKLILEKALKLAKEKRFFHWKLEFPEVWYGTLNSGFDVVLGNPPYNVKLDEREKLFIKEQVNNSKNGRIDSAALFVEHFLKMVNKKGYVSFLLPYRLLSRPRDFGRHQKYIWDKILCFIYIGTVREFESNDEFMIASYQSKRISNKILVGEDIHGEFLKKHSRIAIKKVPENLFGTSKEPFFSIYLINADMNIINKIKGNNSNRILLGNIAESKDGIVVHVRKALISDTKKDERYRKLLGIAGKYILNRYFLWWGGTWICYDINEARKYLKRRYMELKNEGKIQKQEDEWIKQEIRKVQLRDERIFNHTPRIITRQDATRLIGTIDYDGYYHTNSIHSTYLRQNVNYSAEFILAILNSSLIGYYYETYLNRKGKDLHPQILVTNIPKIPIPKIDFANKNLSVVNVLKSKYDNDEFFKILKKIKFFPQNSVVLHDFLSYLAQKMIELNQNKYLLQLFVENKLEIGTDEMIKVIKLLEKHPEWENNASDVLKREIARNLIGEYETKITQTDNLIDQIVYHLYGLTDEEIKVIEAKVKI